MVLDSLDVFEFDPGEGDGAPCGETAVQRRARRGERSGHSAAGLRALDDIAQRPDGTGQHRGDETLGSGYESRQTAQCHLQLAALGRQFGQKRHRRIGFLAAQLGKKFGVGNAVCCRMVHLEQHVQTMPVDGTVGALDHPHLPQRPTPLDRHTDERPAHFGQFLRTAGVPDGDAVNVPVDVEVGVGNPCRVVEIEARVGKLLLKGRDSAHAHPQCLAEPFEVVTAGNRRGIQFQHCEQLHGLISGLQIEEAGVEAGEPLWT